MIPIDATGSSFERSRALLDRARNSLSGGVSTSFRMGERPTPLFIERAEGAHLVDADGNSYVDYTCGYGPIILGHANPAVSEAVARAARGVQQVGGQHEAEVELAETLCRVIPSFERIRPALSGSEAVHAALRLSRAFTDRPLVVKFAGQYHGWLDGIFAATASLPPVAPESAGQVETAIADLRAIEWNDPTQLGEIFASEGDRIAALIMEPLPCNGGVIPAQPGFLELARKLTAEHGSILIFDEVISGFRVALGGAQEMLGVTPDLTIVAKAMGNGFPVSAFGGRADLMELLASNRVVHAGTYNGGGISVAAAIATLGALEAEPVHARLSRLGSQLMEGLVAVAASHGFRLVAQGPGPVFFTWFLTEGEVTTYRDHLRADHALYQAFAQGLLEKGVRVIPAGRWYLNAAHTEEDVASALAAADGALATLSRTRREDDE